MGPTRETGIFVRLNPLCRAKSSGKYAGERGKKTNKLYLNSRGKLAPRDMISQFVEQ